MRAPDRSLRAPLALATALACVLAAAPASAAPKLDRSKPPVAGPNPVFHVPAWTRTTLPDGAELLVVPKHDLPLVSVTMTFLGGSCQFDPPDETGLGTITAQMLSEGTTTRTADQLSEAQQMLGTTISADVSDESGSIGFTALSDRFEPALELMADMVLHPTFPAASLERLRGQTLVSLRQRKDQPNAIASIVFAHVLYGSAHPYGRVMNEAGVKAITRDEVVAFHEKYYRPGRAVVTVAGDVEPAAVKAAFEKAFAGWPAGGERPDWKYPPLPAPEPTVIDLVDKPGAAQSVFAIGEPGPPRSTPDYYALSLMNTILGGLFQSRLNHDIREVRGWSYGVRSRFDFGHGPGAFEAGGGIITAKTDSALVAFMAHLRGVRGGVPFTADELQQGRQSLVQSLPRRFASVEGTASAIAALATQGLPDTYYRDYPGHIRALKADDLVRVARKYLDLDHLHIVIVGDRSVIQAPLAATRVAPIVVLDTDGNPVPHPNDAGTAR